MNFLIKRDTKRPHKSVNIKKRSQGQTYFNWLSSKKNCWGKTMHDFCWGQYESFQIFQVSIRKPNAVMENLFKSNALSLENIEEIYISKS